MSTLDEAMELLESELRVGQRIWIMERNKLGSWGVGVARDLPESEWPEPNEHGVTLDSDKWITFAYRREPTLIEALIAVRNDVIAWNADHDDKEAEEKFVQPINPDYISKIAKGSKGK
jgi:hypothetical protein